MLKTRIKTGIILALAGILLIFCLGPGFVFAWWIIFGVIMWEWASMTEMKEVSPVSRDALGKMMYVLVFIFFSAFAFFLPLLTLKIGLLFWIFAFVSFFFSQKSLGFLVSEKGYLLTGLFLLVPSWLAGFELYIFSPWLLFFAILVIAASDTGAYFAGKKFGKHFLAPHLSPKKTWEGASGGLVAGILVGIVFSFFGNKLIPSAVALPMVGWIFLSIVLVVFGIIGDLFESQIKRLVGVKDSGKLLPGHGGFLDRFDSHFAGLVAAAFIVLLL